MSRILRLFIMSFIIISLLVSYTGMAEETPATEILKIGAQGQGVVDLQMRLRDLGYFNYKVTGYFGPATFAALKNFQENNGIGAYGQLGPKTTEVLYSCSAVREQVAESTISGLLPVSRGGRSSFGAMVDWYSSGQYLFPRNTSAKVTDLYTGITFTMIRTGGYNHADAEPATKEDTDKMRRIWGGWSWSRRPVILEIGGERIAASMHGMPHAYNRITGNGMQGHVCIHFYKSRTHISNRLDADHQAAVKRAAGQ